MRPNAHFSVICDHVLERLFDLTCDRETFAYVRHIRAGEYVSRSQEPGEDWLNENMTRAALKQLRDDGLIQFKRGLVDDEGMPAGSGYRLTLEGVRKIAE